MKTLLFPWFALLIGCVFFVASADGWGVKWSDRLLSDQRRWGRRRTEECWSNEMVGCFYYCDGENKGSARPLWVNRCAIERRVFSRLWGMKGERDNLYLWKGWYVRGWWLLWERRQDVRGGTGSIESFVNNLMYSLKKKEPTQQVNIRYLQSQRVNITWSSLFWWQGKEKVKPRGKDAPLIPTYSRKEAMQSTMWSKS